MSAIATVPVIVVDVLVQSEQLSTVWLQFAPARIGSIVMPKAEAERLAAFKGKAMQLCLEVKEDPAC